MVGDKKSLGRRHLETKKERAAATFCDKKRGGGRHLVKSGCGVPPTFRCSVSDTTIFSLYHNIIFVFVSVLVSAFPF